MGISSNEVAGAKVSADPGVPPPHPSSSCQALGWTLAAWAAWLVLPILLSIRLLLAPGRGTTFDLYRTAGAHWLNGELLYVHHNGFVYSPLIAALLAPCALIPRNVGAILWLVLNVSFFLAGVTSIIQSRLFVLTRTQAAAALLVLVPLTIGNLDVAQANPLLIGLVMLSVAQAKSRRVWWAALFIALGVYLKLYPLAIALLILTAIPFRFTIPLLVTLSALGLLPFLLQHPSYVQEQYKIWLLSRVTDNRLESSGVHAPLDMWFLLTRVAGLGIAPSIYRLLQLLAGGAVALYCLLGRRRQWSPARLFAGLFCFGSIWMTLFGMATEGFTYLLLAPAVTLACLQTLPHRPAPWLRPLGVAALVLLLLAVAKNSLIPRWNQIPWLHALQPIAALLFAGYCLHWLLSGRYWRITNTAVISLTGRGGPL